VSRANPLTRRRAALATLALAAGGALAVAAPAAQPTAPAAKPAAAPTDPAAPAEFDHAAHAALNPPVDIARCAACHDNGERGALVPPGRTGHQPCLASGCHVDDFLASGARVAKDDPERHARATRFCRGCHGGAPGTAPSRASKATVDPAWHASARPSFHVELDHLMHTAKTRCRSCHSVDPTTFALVAGAPGHAQCSTCHDDKAPAPPAGQRLDGPAPMAACETCHAQPGPSAYFTKTRPPSDVRSCGSEPHQALSAAAKTEVPCFKHERVEHRTRGAQPIECASCHFMIDDKAKWGGHRYRTVAELRAAPIIHNKRDLAHQSCGAAGCHADDVKDSRGTANCKLCHSNKVVIESIFD
jgi:hypothetical protein